MRETKIGIVGLGYVGLPLACLFATKYPVVGYDKNKNRILELISGIDSNGEFSKVVLSKIQRKSDEDKKKLSFSHEFEDLRENNFYIITVPTPVDKNNVPDLSLLLEATSLIGSLLKKDDIVVYESTVFPGVTEEKCVPLLEEISALKCNEDFFIGYSPERVNPGDKLHSIDKVVKIISGSTKESAKIIEDLYGSVIPAGTFLAENIKVAEAAKAIENAQRDVNIAFMNEISKIFGFLGIDTNQVLAAASTKWNFLPFSPGLVGGHCIGVDPYYLTHKAQEYGYYPELLLMARRINDGMGKYIADKVVELLIQNDLKIKDSNVLIFGFTFKENCKDIRNTKVMDIIAALGNYGVKIDIYDPWANSQEVIRHFNLSMIKSIGEKKYEGIIVAVAHDVFQDYQYKDLLTENGILYDVKGFLNCKVDGKL